jgi:hypothetical protein
MSSSWDDAKAFDKAKAEIGERVSAVLGDVADFDDLDTLYTVAENERAPVLSNAFSH